MNKNNNRRKKNDEQHENAKDILGMIRARQASDKKEYHESEQKRLRDFLNNLDKDTCEEDYSETPIYKLGYEDGEQAGYDKGYSDAYYELFKVLKAIETIIEPHVEKPC